jgi:hypothetical protein
MAQMSLRDRSHFFRRSTHNAKGVSTRGDKMRLLSRRSFRARMSFGSAFLLPHNAFRWAAQIPFSFFT